MSLPPQQDAVHTLVAQLHQPGKLERIGPSVRCNVWDQDLTAHVLKHMVLIHSAIQVCS